MGSAIASEPEGDSVMDEMQQLMDLVTRLQRRGVDVQRLLNGGMPQTPDMRLADRAMPQMNQFTGPGPGATLQPMANPQDQYGMLPMPQMDQFTGPGPGAVVDYEDSMERMKRNERLRQNPMRGLIEMMGRR